MWAEQNLLRTLGKGSIQIGDEGHLNLCDKGKTWTNSRDTEGVGCARPSDSQEQSQVSIVMGSSMSSVLVRLLIAMTNI